MKFLQIDSLSVAEDKGTLSQYYDLLTVAIIVIAAVGLFLILRRLRWDKKGKP